MTLRWMNRERNFITGADMIRPSTEKAGVVGPAVKSGTGSAAAVTGGAFTGPADTRYELEIDSVAAGGEIGQATFRWKDGGSSWTADGVATAGIPAGLNHGVTVRFSGGGFVAGDSWQFMAVKHFGRQRLLDLDRNTGWRSAGLGGPDSLTVDLGEARRVTAVVAADHNFTESAEVRLQANDEDVWEAPAVDMALTVSCGFVVLFPDITRRYWRLTVADPDNPAGYVEIGGLHIGSYLELSGGVIEQDFGRGLWTSDDPAAVGETWDFDLLLTDPAEASALAGFYRAVCLTDGASGRPFYCCRDETAASESTGLFRFGGGLSMVNFRKNYHRVQVRLVEEVQSRV